MRNSTGSPDGFRFYQELSNCWNSSLSAAFGGLSLQPGVSDRQTDRSLKRFKIPATAPVVTGDDVQKAKPAPDIFVLAVERLNVAIDDCIVIGDSVWDILAAARKGALGVGLLSGGYGQEELQHAGAFRIYKDPAELLVHIEDLGISG